MVLALTHGNEIAGAIALDRLLAGGLRPARGRLTFGFVNLVAFARFDPDQPTISRFVDEDMNRIWDASRCSTASLHSVELARAREIRALVESADVLLDLHSMLWPSDPLILCGPTARGKALAQAVGLPELVVADAGHVSGRRIIDHPRFTDPASPARRHPGGGGPALAGRHGGHHDGLHRRPAPRTPAWRATTPPCPLRHRPPAGRAWPR